MNLKKELKRKSNVLTTIYLATYKTTLLLTLYTYLATSLSTLYTLQITHLAKILIVRLATYTETYLQQNVYLATTAKQNLNLAINIQNCLCIPLAKIASNENLACYLIINYISSTYLFTSNSIYIYSLIQIYTSIIPNYIHSNYTTHEEKTQENELKNKYKDTYKINLIIYTYLIYLTYF